MQRLSLFRLHVDNFAKNSSVPLGDGLPVASRDDAEDPCSEAQSTGRAALYDRVFSSRRCGGTRGLWFARGMVLRSSSCRPHCSLPRQAKRHYARCHRLRYEEWQGRRTHSSWKLLDSRSHRTQTPSKSYCCILSCRLGPREMLKHRSSSPAILRLWPLQHGIPGQPGVDVIACGCCFHDLPLIVADTLSFVFVLRACYGM